MAVTPVGNPYVESSDLVANYPGASEALAERIDIVGVNPFANAAARDAAIPSPVQGQMCSLNDDNKGYRYDGSAWVLFSGAGPANFTNTATGTYTDGGISYKYITFTGTGSLTIDVAGLADVLLVAGGGSSRVGSSDTYRGGGGAGGMIYSASKYLAVGTHTVTVGAGGVIDSGGNSNFLDLYAIGGGNGQSGAATVKGVDGGSGSGASGGGRAPGSGVIGQGNDGGYSASAEAGGGGAGGAGSGSMAGVGLSNSITGSAVTYATGGADGTTSAANSGNGGNGDSAGVNGDSGVFIIRVAV